MKTCITCQHYFKDESGSEECARTKKVSQKQSLVDGQTRQLTSYTLCKVERMSGAVASLFIALLVGSRHCGKGGRYWTPQSLESIDITKKTIQIFGSADLAKQWLNTVNLAFGGRTPVSLLETPEERKRLLAVLNAIEQGVLYKWKEK